MDEMTAQYLLFQKLMSFHVQVISLCSLRWMGFFFIFPIFLWANVPPMITMVWAFMFSLPVLPGMAAVLSESNLTIWPITSPDVAADMLSILERKQTTVIMLKEFLLGAMLGFFPSAFFFGFVLIGEMIDQARGDLGARSAEGAGLSMTNCGTILFLTGSIIFFSSGEFLNLIRLIYRSYEVWPLFDLSGFLTPERLYFFLLLSLQMLYGTIKMGLPFLVLMWSFDIQTLYQTKIDKKFQAQDYQPAIKNFTFIFFFIFYLSMSDLEQYNPTLSITSNFAVILEGGGGHGVP